jgi:hypothetical protein
VLVGLVNNVVIYVMVWFGLVRFSNLNSLDQFEMVWIECMCHLDQKLNSKTKNSRSRLNISANLTRICSRCLQVTVRYFVHIIIPRSTRGPHVESHTLKLKAHVHTLKFQRI